MKSSSLAATLQGRARFAARRIRSQRRWVEIEKHDVIAFQPRLKPDVPSRGRTPLWPAQMPPASPGRQPPHGRTCSRAPPTLELLRKLAAAALEVAKARGSGRAASLRSLRAGQHRSMREAGIDVTTIAETLKVSRVTVYRHTEPVTEDVPEVVLAAQVH